MYACMYSKNTLQKLGEYKLNMYCTSFSDYLIRFHFHLYD